MVMVAATLLTVLMMKMTTTTSRTADAGRTTIVDAIVDMNGGGEDQNKCSYSSTYVTVVESLVVTTGPCVTRVACSDSGQPNP